VVAQQSGQVLAAISNAMVAAHREHFGRGPGAARTLNADAVVVVILSDIYTRVERTLIDAGEAEHVREARRLHQLALEDEYKAPVEAVTGHAVEAFLTVTHVDPDLSVTTFLLGEALPA
jgi:uncharacterized protein YbcI